MMHCAAPSPLLELVLMVAASAAGSAALTTTDSLWVVVDGVDQLQVEAPVRPCQQV